MRLALRTLLVVIFLIVPLGCGADGDDNPPSQSSESSEKIPFDKEGRFAFLDGRDTLVVLDLEIAESDSARRRGMMQRSGFPSQTSGMLFPFEEESSQTFIMANTPVALDLFFISADSQVVDIAKYAQPYSSDPIKSSEPAQFVLETPAGFADSYGIIEGHRTTWWRTD